MLVSQQLTHVQVSASSAPYDRSCRHVMASVHIFSITPMERERAAFVSEPCRQDNGRLDGRMDVNLDRVW